MFAGFMSESTRKTAIISFEGEKADLEI